MRLKLLLWKIHFDLQFPHSSIQPWRNDLNGCKMVSIEKFNFLRTYRILNNAKKKLIADKKKLIAAK